MITYIVSWRRSATVCGDQEEDWRCEDIVKISLMPLASSTAKVNGEVCFSRATKSKNKKKQNSFQQHPETLKHRLPVKKDVSTATTYKQKPPSPITPLLIMTKRNTTPRPSDIFHTNTSIRPLCIIVLTRHDRASRKNLAVFILVDVKTMCAPHEEAWAPVDANVVGGAAEGDAAVLILGAGPLRGTATVCGVEGGDGARTALGAGLEDWGLVGGEG